MAKRRDYAAEYKARLQRALTKGYSRAVARGHARKGEMSIKRAKKLLVAPGSWIQGQGRVGFRPTFKQVKKRVVQLQLPLLISFTGKRGKIKPLWIGKGPSRRISTDSFRDKFIDRYTRWGLSAHEAYTLWCSP